MNTLTKTIHNLACILRARPLQQGLVQYLASVWHERKDRRQLRRQAGIALTEMLVATAILATVAVSALLGLSTSIKGTATVTNGRAAMDIAQSQMEYIREQPFAFFEQWDDLDDTSSPPTTWSELQGDETVNAVTIQPDDPAARGREAVSCLRIEAGTDDGPGVSSGNITQDWSEYDRVLLWVRASTTDTIQLRMRTGGGDLATFDAAPTFADEWDRLDFDLTSPMGDFDITTIKEIDIYSLATDDNYVLRIDDFCLADGTDPWPDDNYPMLEAHEVDKWGPSCIDIYVTPDPDGDGNLDLQKIRVTVTYASGTKTFELEGYKSNR